MSRSREEQETIIRFDETDADAYLWTASPRQAARWHKLGYVLVAEPGGWAVRVPKAAIRPLRRVVDGQVVKRKATGTPFGPRIRVGSAENIRESACASLGSVARQSPLVTAVDTHAAGTCLLQQVVGAVSAVDDEPRGAPASAADAVTRKEGLSQSCHAHQSER